MERVNELLTRAGVSLKDSKEPYICEMSETQIFLLVTENTS